MSQHFVGADKAVGFVRSFSVQTVPLTNPLRCVKLTLSTNQVNMLKGNDGESRRGDTAQRARGAGNGYGRPRRTWPRSRVSERRRSLGHDGSARHSARVCQYPVRPVPRGPGEARWYHEAVGPFSSLTSLSGAFFYARPLSPGDARKRGSHIAPRKIKKERLP